MLIILFRYKITKMIVNNQFFRLNRRYYYQNYSQNFENYS